MSIMFISIASVALAIVTAGCIAYVAWDLTSDNKQSSASDDNGRPDSE